MSFERELTSLINRFSLENESNTPDFILAEYIRGSLSAFTKATREREKWYGKELKIQGPVDLEPPKKDPNACCENEDRGWNGGCKNCGDPAL